MYARMDLVRAGKFSILSRDLLLRQLFQFFALVALLVLSGCDNEPEHYYALCDSKDYNGWNLINTEYEDGYLMACTYQSPDREEAYTVRCRETGCD